MAISKPITKTAVSVSGWGNAVTDEVNLATDHRQATTSAHPASAISSVPAGTIAANTVQGALNELGTEKASLVSPTFTGTVQVPNAVELSSPPTLSQMQQADNLKAPLASPTFTGTVQVPDGLSAPEAASYGQVVNLSAQKIDKTTMTTDGDLITRAGGIPARITRAGLAADPAFTSAFAGSRRTVKADTSTGYTPILSDENQMITLSNAAAITVTLPSDATTNFPIGAEVDFLWYGTGKPTFAAGAGATANATPALGMRARYSAATAKKIAANTWVVLGDLG